MSWPNLTRKSWSKANLSNEQIEAASKEWLLRGRLEQIPPRGDWNGWLLIGGRGSGKTRAGAEWINALVRGLPVFSKSRIGQIALIGETIADVRDVMVEGPSGILAVAHKGHRPKFEISRRRVLWPNGASAMLFSAEDPDSLRGPQFEAAWCDELAARRSTRAQTSQTYSVTLNQLKARFLIFLPERAMTCNKEITSKLI